MSYFLWHSNNQSSIRSHSDNQSVFRLNSDNRNNFRSNSNNLLNVAEIMTIIKILVLILPVKQIIAQILVTFFAQIFPMKLFSSNVEN